MKDDRKGKHRLNEVEDDARYDAEEGILGIIGASILLIFVILMAASGHGSEFGVFILAGTALILMNWGVRRVRSAKKRKQEGTKSTTEEGDDDDV
jgi:hypothetical protein